MTYATTMTMTLLGPRVARRCFSGSLHPRQAYDIVFLGSDGFSAVVLDTLHRAASPSVKSLRVVTMPDYITDRRKGTFKRPRLRTHAEGLGLPVELYTALDEMTSFRDIDVTSVLVTASWGQLVPTSLLSRFAPRQALNVHPSLLPLYRGAAPIQWSIANGRVETGVSVQELSKGRFDRGDLLMQENVALPAEASYATLEPMLAERGGRMLVDLFENFEVYKETARAQAGEATLAPKITRQHAFVDNWSEWTADRLLRAHRGYGHQYPLHCTFQGHRLSFLDLFPLPPDQEGVPGTITYHSQTHHAILHCAQATSLGLRQLRPGSVRDIKGISARLWWSTHITNHGLGPIVHLDSPSL